MEHLSGLPWRGVRYFSTTRQGGAGTAPWDSFNLAGHVGDAPKSVDENRRHLGRHLPGEPLWLEQVHGCDVCNADHVLPGTPPRADAAVTTTQRRVLAIMTADCLPVVMADDRGKVLGVAHAGWRGLAAGVIESTLSEMRRRAPGASGWRAWIGPAISQAHFEVGNEVHEAFVGADPELALYFVHDRMRGRWLADLASIARHRLDRAGVAQVECSGRCTYADPDRFFSYRRQARTGRQATLAWLDTP